MSDNSATSSQATPRSKWLSQIVERSGSSRPAIRPYNPQPQAISSLVPDSVFFNPVSTSSAVYEEAPKSAESRRQIKRLLDALSHHSELSHTEHDALADERVKSAISLLQNFVVGPLEIPIASIDAEGSPSLFINSDNMYADLTFDGKFADYYLRYKVGDEIHEEFEKEIVEDGRVPAKLFGSLVQVMKNK